MKRTVKAFALILTLMAVCFGCDYRENIVDYQAGVWDVKSMNTKTYRDGMLVSDVTKSDSLGQMQFERTGQGFRIQPTTAVDTFTWENYPKEERLIIYYRIGPFANAAILNRTANAMTLYWINENGEGAVMVKTERTAVMERRK